VRKLTNPLEFIRRQPRWRLLALAGAVVLVGVLVWTGRTKTSTRTPTFVARRGPLEINVLEGGSLQALESQEIKCEVRVGYQGTKILKIVEEGYFVSEDDVRTNKVLVELDGSDLQKQIVQQEIQYQTAAANLTDAQQNYEIQLGQNQSDISAAEQKARFARLDFDKLLGGTVTAKIIEEVGLDQVLAAAITNNVEETARAQEVSNHRAEPPPGAAVEAPGLPAGAAQALLADPPRPGSTSGARVLRSAQTETQKIPAATEIKTTVLADGVIIGGQGPVPGLKAPEAPTQPGAPPLERPKARSMPPTAAGAGAKPAAPELPDTEMLKAVAVDFSKYASLEALGDGEAKQKLRKFDDDLQVAQKELEQTKSKLEGTRRLFDKGFVTKTELQQDDIAFENSRLKVQTAETARDLFRRYDFLKSAEESLSKYAEAVREFDKARRVAVSKMAQAKARLNSAQGQYEVQSRQLKDFNEQLAKCTLRARKSGLVVYGGSRDDMMYYGGEERIREGATVRERQAIITIPDMSRMAVNVKIHESYIKKVKKGQKARITVDAFPDTILAGEVTKVGVLPDSNNRWMNPDMKVYLTTITIEGTYDWVKPGMSAKVEILVNKLDNCVYVPVQAISPDNGKQVCYVANGLKPERREVQVGEFNDEFIEVKQGLKEGERVLLRTPAAPESPEGVPPAKEDKSAPADKKPQRPPSIPATASKV
jgi:RND family efflux transporter MFP subunit